MKTSNFIQRLSQHPEIKGSVWLLMTNERFVSAIRTDQPVKVSDMLEVFEPKENIEKYININ